MAVLAVIGKILAALLIFSVIVMLHEFGHFILAKLNHVKVNEFAIGMGPKLLQFGKGETKYTLRLLPIGGFCAMEGEDPDTVMPEAVGGHGEADEASAAARAQGRAFYQKKVWQRILIVLAGPVMNLLLGYLLLVVNYAFLEQPNKDGEVLFSTTTIHSLPEESPAYQSGLRAGDTVLSINGRRVVTADFDMTAAMQTDEDGVLDMVVRRAGEKVELPAVKFNLNTAPDGTRYLVYDFVIVGQPRTFGSTLSFALKNEYSVGVMIWRSLGDMLTGKYGLNDLSGPVGVVDIVGDAVESAVTETDHLAGVRTLMLLIIVITVNLGIFNLLPLPALDGGRLVFLLIELIFRRRVPPKYEGIVNLVGLILLLLLMAVITYSDITKLIGGG